MEVLSFSSSKPQTLTLITSSTSTSSPPPHFLPLPGRRRLWPCGGGGGGGLQLRRARGRLGLLGFRIQPPSCLLSESAAVLDGSVAVVAAAASVVAAACLAALQLVSLSCGSTRKRGPPEVLHEQDTSIVNREVPTSTKQSVYESDSTSGTTRENVFAELCGSERMNVDLPDPQLGLFSDVKTVHKTTQAGYVVPRWTCSIISSADTSGTEQVSCSSSTDNTYAIEKDTSILEVSHFLPEERHEVESFSDMPGRVAAPTRPFFSLSTRTEQAENGQGPMQNRAKIDDANLLGCSGHGTCDQEADLDLTSLSSFKSSGEKPLNFILQVGVSNLFQPRKVNKAANSYVGGSYFTSGQRVPVACLKEGPASKRKKAVKDHNFAKAIGWSLSDTMNKENPDTFAQPNGLGAKGRNDPSEYLRRYSSLMTDGRLNNAVLLLESMEQKRLLDMKKIHHASFLNACKKQRSVKEAIRFCKLIDNPKMSTFNMLLSVCASSQDFDGAFQVMLLLKEAGLKPDCKLYTTLISTCAKCGKVDAMFEVFHEMVNAGIEPNVKTYGALIDGCAKAGQVAKAFGAYGIMSSKKVKPDRVVFNALISACGESGAVARAFDVLAEMTAEPSESKESKPILPDHVTVGALMKTCIQAGQADRAREVYKMLQQYNIKGTSEVYTIALRSCSLTGDFGFALKIYDDMNKNGVKPDEVFLSALVDVAGHAGKADAAVEIIKDARAKGMQVGTVAYSSLMGACCNAKNWKKALELFEEINSIKLTPTVSMMNALITSLCDGDQILKSVEVFDEMNKLGVQPNEITYSVLIVACERKGEAQLGLELFERLKMDGVHLNPTILGCLTGLCLQMFEKDCSLGNIIVRFNSGKPQIDNRWTSSAIKVYREAISAGLLPSNDVLSQVLGCLRFPRDTSLKNSFIENLGISCDVSKHPNINSLLEAFGEYDVRAFSILEEAASLGVVPITSIKDGPIFVDTRKLQIYTAEVHLLTTLRCLKHRLAAGARLPNVTILLPTEKTQIGFDEGGRSIKLAGRVGQAVGSLLRRLGISYQGDESHGKMRINGLALRRWFNPKFTSTSSVRTPADMLPLSSRLAKGIADQQRNIRNLSLE